MIWISLLTMYLLSSMGFVSTHKIVKSEIQKGRTLEEMKNSHILAEWVTWGKHIPCDMWIEIIYHCITNSISQME